MDSAIQTRTIKKHNETDLPNGKKAIGSKWVFRNKKDQRGIVVRNKARLVAQGFVDPAHPNKVYKVKKALYGLHQAPRAWYETLSTYLLENGFRRGTIDKTLFIKKIKDDILLIQVEQRKDGIFLSQDKYVKEILQKFGYSSVKSASTPMETHKPLTKDKHGTDVDVHLYKSMIRSLMYLTSSRPDIVFAVCLLYPKASPLELVAFSDSDYACASLDRKSTTGGCQFLGCRLVSWQCKKQAIVANSITEAEYIAASNYCAQVLWLQNQLFDFGYNFMKTKIHIYNENAICVVKNPVYHSKTKHIEIRYHFIRDCYKKGLIDMAKIHIDNNVADLLTKAFDVIRTSMDLKMNESYADNVWVVSIYFWSCKQLTLHNMVAFLKKPSESDGFTEAVDFLRGTHLNFALTHNLTVYDSLVKQFWQTATVRSFANGTQQIEASIDSKSYTITVDSVRTKLQLADATGDFVPLPPAMMARVAQGPTPTFVADEATFTSVEVETERATTTTSGLDVGLDSGNINETLLMSHETSPQEGHPSRNVEDSMKLQELMILVPKLQSRIGSLKTELRDTKQTFGNALLTLVKKVKTLEVALKRKSKQVVLPELDNEETEAQGRKIQDIDDDPLISLVEDFITPTKTKDSPQEEVHDKDISPTTLEAAKILSKVASQAKLVDKGRRYKRRKGPKGKEVSTGGIDFNTGFEDVSSGFNEDQGFNTGSLAVSTGIEKVSTGSLAVSTGSGPISTDSTKVIIPSPVRSRREGKAPMTEEEETQAPKKTREQILQEEASLAEAIRLDSIVKEEMAKQIHLDSLLAKRMAEQELNWDTIRAKLEANEELTKSMIGSDLQQDDFAKKMVEMVNQRKKYFAEQRAKAKREKPMTQTQLKNYMMTFLKNQGTWKLTQLKKLSFEEVRAEFEKLVKQIESFVPMSFEATKAHLKRFDEKVTEAKEEVSKKKSGKRIKQIARKGLHPEKAETEKDTSEKEDPTSGTDIPINLVPVATKPPSIANYKIIKQGHKGVYQIVRANGSDKVYISFGAMLKDISRDDLTELYRIVMHRYGMNEPEDEHEKVFWGYMKNIVHCLNLESAEMYMLTERIYPLSAEVCNAILNKKLQGGQEVEDCYQLLKKMEKQAGIKKD
ncbi:putative ribonuclease H-like domain-containing protein [Tanacetum coccineum]